MQRHFEELFFQPNRANRLDMHWNSQPHIAKAAAGAEPKAEEAKAEEAKAEAPVAEVAPAEETAAAEPEPVQTYETERKHASVSQFKRSMGLFVDNFKLKYA